MGGHILPCSWAKGKEHKRKERSESLRIILRMNFREVCARPKQAIAQNSLLVEGRADEIFLWHVCVCVRGKFADKFH